MDIVIRGGTVFDGTGSPEFEADIGITDGIITAIGKISDSGKEEIDAYGQIVTPGFVDIHTHYDGQAVWDSHLAPSSVHGVTTVLMGNCGVGFAPCKPGDRDRLVELMEGVEDIPAPVMNEGLDWKWQTFAEYLDRIEQQPHDLDIAALVPHAPLRVHAMGARASHLDVATDAEIAEMRALARDAARAGAFGFSTSRTVSHKTLAGEYMPTLRAQEKELTQIALGIREGGGGLIELVSDWELGHANEFAMMRRVVENSGLPMVFSMNQRNAEPDKWKIVVEACDRAVSDGLNMRPVFPPRAIGVMMGLSSTQNPFSGCPTYKSISHLPLTERVKAMRDPEIRAKILSEDPVKESTFPLMHLLGYDWMFPLGDPVDYEPKQENCITAIAAREGRSAPEVAYDILLSDEGRNFIYVAIVNYASYDLSFSEALLANKNAIVGLSDGGAHVGFISDGGFPTFLLTHWGRDRATGKLPLAELIRRQTSDTAHTMGLYDRGVIGLGKKADVNVIDFDRLALKRPYLRADLPSGAKRFLQDAEGYTATIKSGAISYRNGESTGALKGVLLRGGPRAATAAAAE